MCVVCSEVLLLFVSHDARYMLCVGGALYSPHFAGSRRHLICSSTHLIQPRPPAFLRTVVRQERRPWDSLALFIRC